MVEEILFINIGYKDGLYVFENGDIDLDIPNEIMVNTPFYNQANSFEELVDTLLLEPEEHIVFTYNYNNQRLVRKLACTLLKEYEKTVYLINSNLCNAVCNVDSQNSLYLLKNYEDLHNVDQLSLQVITEIPELNLHSLPDIENSYYVTMRNGYDAFVTGIYPQNVSNTLAKHIQLEKHVTIKDTSEYLDINGAFLVNMEDVKDIDIQDKNNFNHLHTIKEEKVQFDETKVSLKNFICSYSQVEDIKRKGKCLLDYEYYLKIENKNDLEKFSVDLDFYKQTGKVDTISKRLVDECRWTNQCSLKRLTRYRVEVDGIEISKSMISRFYEKQNRLSEKVKNRLNIYNADIFEYETEKQYDLITIPSTTICLLADDEVRTKNLFRKIYKWLKPGGRFMFDYRVDQSLTSEFISPIFSEVDKKMPYVMFMQEFNNIIVGRGIVNMYVETMENGEPKKYIASSNKKIITDSLVKNLLQEIDFQLHNTYMVEMKNAKVKLIVLEKEIEKNE